MTLSRIIFIFSMGFLLLALLGLIMLPTPVAAQSGEPAQPSSFIYIVQPGDTLVSIALRYNLNLADLIRANNISNRDLIFPGQELIIPGISTAEPAPATSSSPLANPIHIVQPGETLFTIAQKYGLSLGAIIQANNIAKPDVLQVGQALDIPLGPAPTPQPLTPPFVSVDFSEPTIIQGRTLIIKVQLSVSATLTGTFEGRPILFQDSGAGQFWGITAVHAMVEPLLYPVIFTATLPNGAQTTLTQNVTVVDGPYDLEDIELDETRGQLLDEQLIQNEQEKLNNLWSQITLQPLWQSSFIYPVDPSTLRITSNFGTRRSYNSGPVASFHGGTDFGGEIGLPIIVPAAGKVVLAEKLMVRGNAVLIDHGLGLFSGYWHMNGIAVQVGQAVKPGDLIGYLGDTGLVTGPHLHWEMRLNGIAVEPLQWVQQTIP